MVVREAFKTIFLCRKSIDLTAYP